MSSVQVNFKMDSKIKKNAQKVASEIGVSLSDVWNSCVREFILKKSITFSASEEPSDYLIKSIEKSREEFKKGDYYHFDNSKDALDFIDKRIKRNQSRLKKNKK